MEKACSAVLRQKTKWVCPPSGRLKIHCDGAFDVVSGKGGIGVVVRDDGGAGIAAMTKSFRHASSALCMEFEACRAGLHFGAQQGWTDVEIECDSILLVTALQSTSEDFSMVGHILSDCRDLLTNFSSVRICHVFREANGVADRLARIAKECQLDKVWIGETPAIIQDVLIENLHDSFPVVHSNVFIPANNLVCNTSSLINNKGKETVPM